MKKFLVSLASIAVVVIVCIFIARSGSAPTAEELTRQYPDISSNSTIPENPKILCPFLRMMHRAGIVELQSSVLEITNGAQELGCGMLECGGVAAKVSKGQDVKLKSGFGPIDLTQLHQADGVAHDCGFTFAKGGQEVDSATRQASLDLMKEKATKEGHLSFENILEVKKEICRSQGVTMSEPGFVEVKLIYGYLGGVDRGYVHLEDVRKLFHAEMPTGKTTEWIRFKLFKAMPEAPL